MEDFATNAVDAGKKPSAWVMLGGVLIAWCLPPVFALFILNRWKDVSQRLRAAAIVLSFLFPVGYLLVATVDKLHWRTLLLPFCFNTGIFMYASFILSWQRHIGTQVSRLLKTCFWFILVFMNFLFLLALGHLAFPSARLTF